MIDYVAPILIVSLGIPLAAGWVARNVAYGFRSRRTMASDEIWYPVNRASGWSTIAAGLVWLLAGHVAGLIALALSVVGTAAYAGWLVARRTE
jgi:hypothetical protein